jgi:hypothetical protein
MNKTSESRRNFLKTSAIGAAGLAIIGPGMKKATAADVTVKLVDLTKTQINQDINNLRVAYITDAAMVRSNVWQGFATFNSPTGTTNGVVYSAVKANMDKLACALANKTDPAVAWDTILKIPSSKTWATAKAVIKINGIGNATTSLHASVPILVKLIEVLMGKGMPAANITIFDMPLSSITSLAPAIYSSFQGAGKPIPAGVVLGAAGTDNVAVFPAGWRMTATRWLPDADIYINVANNKGHDRTAMFSGVTMCLKNNFGTVCFNHNNAPVGYNGMDWMAAANSCDYILGDIPATYPAKGQLCIIDSLWLGNASDWAGAASNGNNANTILMGTFAGALDYVGTKLIRIPKLPAGINLTIVDQFMTKFGYTAADITTIMTETTVAGKGLVDASKITMDETVPYESRNLARRGYVRFSVSGNGIRPLNATLYLAEGEMAQSAALYTVQGKLVRTLSFRPGADAIDWDGKTESGRIAGAGTYIVKITGQRTTAAEQIVVRK